jgi:hypothetical protein
MFKVTAGNRTRTASTLRDVWIVAIYDGVPIILEYPDKSTQSFDSYDAFTTYLEENT